MFKRYFILLWKGAIIIFLSGCGMSTILVNNSDVDLYVNNIYKGKGRVEIKRMGIPKKINIDAKYRGHSVGNFTVRRKFDLVTLAAGCYTYGLGLFFCWRYPETIFVPINIDNEHKNEHIWRSPPQNWR